MTLAGPSAALEGLRGAVRGPVRLPGDPDFDDVRRPWNLSVEQDVAAVVSAADAADVAELVRYAARVGVGVSPQPIGHGATGAAAGTVLLRTGQLDRIDVDPVARTARIGAGVRSGDLQRAVAEHGLTALPGSSPEVSVAGVALGGGLSWFGRAFGWVSDGVTALDVVDADGAARTVSPESDPDLFWALRGGGGDYAVVTGLELTLHAAPSVVGGRVLWEGRHARRVAEAYRALTADAPRELTVWLELMRFPWSDPMVALDVTFLGTEEDAREAMALLDHLPQPLADSRRPMSVAELGTITDEPTEPAPGMSRGEVLTRIDDDVVSALVADPGPLNLVQVRHLGGALAEPSDSPHGPLEEPHLLYLLGVPASPDSAGAIATAQQELARALPSNGRKPVTFLGPGEHLGQALPAASLDRLRRIKTERDPRRVLRSSASVLDIPHDAAP